MHKLDILLFGYNRYEHICKVIDAIIPHNNYINSIILHLDGISSIDVFNCQSDIINYFRDKCLLNNIKYIIKTKLKNEGVALSITGGVSEYVNSNSNGLFVVLEDDCVPLFGFIEYQFKLLNYYKDNDSVYTICGYQYINNNETILEFNHIFNPWGWGSWSTKWNFSFADKLNIDVNKLPIYLREVIKSDYRYLTGELGIWSISIIIYQFLNNKLSIYPHTSLIQNIGMDGSGVHSKESSIFDNNSDISCSKYDIDDINMITTNRYNELLNFLVKNYHNVI